jgi:membrane-bound ClpP family serine protease
MLLALGLLAIALLLIYIEFFLPGGILGIAGGIAFLASLAIFANESPTMSLFALYLIFSIACLVFLIKWTLKSIERKAQNNSIYLADDQEGFVASSFDESLINKQGEAISDLRLSGFIMVHEQRYQAISKSGYIPKGTPIEVVGGDGGHLIVKKIEEDNFNRG